MILTLLTILIFSLNTNAQSYSVGTSYEPVFLDSFRPLQGYSLAPNVVFKIRPNKSSVDLRLSLGQVSRISAVFNAPIPFAVVVGYAYHYTGTEQNYHALEAGFKTGFKTKQGFNIDLGLNGGFLPLIDKFYLSPNIAITKRL